MNEIFRTKRKLSFLEAEGFHDLLEDLLIFAGNFPYTGEGRVLMAKELRKLYLEKLKELVPPDPKQKTIFDEHRENRSNARDKG